MTFKSMSAHRETKVYTKEKNSEKMHTRVFLGWSILVESQSLAVVIGLFQVRREIKDFTYYYKKRSFIRLFLFFWFYYFLGSLLPHNMQS
jgi:hypothetical protein